MAVTADRRAGQPDLSDADGARELVNAALRGAKDALGELRELARGIHPPVLDNGLADALATLAVGSAIPAELTVSVPVRPTSAIETIACFCAAELLANAAKHSEANKIKIDISERAGVLVLDITGDGRGGANPARGSGLSGPGWLGSSRTKAIRYPLRWPTATQCSPWRPGASPTS